MLSFFDFLQMFQPTALPIRGLMTSGERSFMNMDQMAVAEDEVRGPSPAGLVQKPTLYTL